MKNDRFLEVETTEGKRYLVNVDFVIAMKDEGERGGILFVEGMTSEGTRSALKLNANEVAAVRGWLTSH